MSEQEEDDGVLRFQPDGMMLNAFLRSRADFDVIQGPIGSGKTDTAIMRLFWMASEQKPQRDGIRRTRWAVVRQTAPELKTTTIRSFLEMFPEGEEKDGGFGHMSWSPPFTYRMRYGDIDAEFIFLALDKEEDAKKLKSLQVTGIYFNEMQFISLSLVNEGLSRCGRYPGTKSGGCTWSGGIADMNAPEGMHWLPIMFGKVPMPDSFSKEERQRHERPPDWNLFIQPPALLELDDHYRALGLKALNPGAETEYCVNPQAENLRWLQKDYYAKKIWGASKQWIDANCRNIAASVMRGRAVHPLFRSIGERQSHVAQGNLKYQPELELFVGLDFGLTPAACIGQTTRGRVFVLYELTAEDIGAVTFAPMLKQFLLQKIPNLDINAVRFIGDPGGNTRGQSDEKTPYDIFRQNGMLVTPAPGANRFSKPGGRKEVVDTLLQRQVDGYQALLIDPRALKLIGGMAGGYQWKTVKSSAGEYTAADVDKGNPYSHICDAFQYLLLGMGEGGSLLFGKDRPKSVDTRVQARVFDRGRRAAVFGRR